MRGKKIDTGFVGSFVASCVKEEKVSTEDIIAEAQRQIKIIDQKIIEVEDLKKMRCKLCDVVISFEQGLKANIKNKSDDRLILDFHSVEDKKMSLEFISSMEKNNQVVFEFPEMGNFKDPQGMIFCIKQMWALKIIDKQNETFTRGENYQSYLDFLNKSSYIRPMNKDGFIKYGTNDQY